MKTQRKRLSAILISAVLTLSNFAGILPQSSVLAAEESVQTEMVQVEPASSEAQQEPAQESAPAEKDQQQKPASAEEAQPAPTSSEATQSTPAPVEEPAVVAPAESVSTPEPAAAETSVTPQQESAAPAESQSAQNSTDTQQSASNGKLTEKEGQTGGKDETVTADHAAAATKMVTVEYIAGNGGTVDRDSETVDVLSADAALLGSTATAQEGYQFVDWTASDDSIVSSNASFVPALSADMPEKTVYIANFKKTDTMPAQDFEGSVSGVQVSVHADEGRFPEGTTMHLAPVSKASILNNDSVQDAVGEDKEVVDAIAVDITFLNKDGKEIEPAGAISVSMSTSRDVSGESHQVLHIDDSGNASQVIDASADGASFEASEFSIYVIAGADNPAIATYHFYDDYDDADRNEITSAMQKVKNGEKVYAPTTPEKTGSKFLGWSYTNENVLKAGDPRNFEQFTASVSKTGDVYLYPVFQQAYYVFFMDGTGEPKRVIATKEGVSGDGIDVADVTIPLDSTHSVTGWYTEAELTHKVESITLSDHNVTLYPKVEEGHYLYFSSGEGASYVKPVFVAAGKNTVEPEAPTRPGYTFKYWSEKENGSESEYKFNSTISADITLHAVWEANTNTKYTVIYWWENANDSNYSYHENSVETGTTGNKIDLTGVSRSYDGFTLNTEKTNAANADAVIAGDGSTIVNVYYSRKTYEIKFFRATKTGRRRYSWHEMKNLHISAKYGANISDKWPRLSTCKNWGTKKGAWEGEQPYQSGISTMPLDGASFYYVKQSGKYTVNLLYYLEGLDGKYSLHHTDSFTTWKIMWKTTAEDHYDIEGFSYTYNVKDGSYFLRPSENVYAISFEYERNDYSIKFVNGDSTTSKTFKYGADVSKVDLTTPPERPAGIPSDYVFAGWFDNELGVGGPATLTGTMPANNITLYAKWAAPTYTGTVHTKIDGTDTPMQLTINYGNKINEKDMPTVKDSDDNIIQKGSSSYTVNVPQGYTWAGWATKSGNDYINYNFSTKVYSNITLYPYYINGEKYTVTYKLGSAEGTAPTDSKLYAENAYADIQPATGVKPPEGKTFLYWSHDTNKYYPGDKVKITGNLKLSAVYGDTSALTSITYHSNYPEGSGLTDSTQVVDKQENNTAITLEKAGFTAPTGYYFVYWNDASGKRYDVGTKIGIDNGNTFANDLYAVWEQKKEITLTVNSGTFEYTKGANFKEDNYEITKEGTLTVTAKKVTDNPPKDNSGTTPAVKTGDDSMIQLYGWLALFAAAAMAGCFMELRKRRTR